MADFKKALMETLKLEGGYSDHKKDPGGKTNFGITEKTARNWGYKGAMKDLTLKEAGEIYKKGYWDKVKGDSLISQEVAQEAFDTAVNCGVGNASKFLQKAYNKLKKGSPLSEDGKIGPATVRAINSYNRANRIVKAANAEQARYYCELVEKNEKLEAFYFGWLDHRVEI